MVFYLQRIQNSRFVKKRERGQVIFGEKHVRIPQMRRAVLFQVELDDVVLVVVVVAVRSGLVFTLENHFHVVGLAIQIFGEATRAPDRLRIRNPDARAFHVKRLDVRLCRHFCYFIFVFFEGFEDSPFFVSRFRWNISHRSPISRIPIWKMLQKIELLNQKFWWNEKMSIQIKIARFKCRFWVFLVTVRLKVAVM